MNNMEKVLEFLNSWKANLFIAISFLPATYKSFSQNRPWFVVWIVSILLQLFVAYVQYKRQQKETNK